MKLNLSTRYVIAFFALLFVLHEAHELAHTSVGRLFCGAWGPRDFNNWSLTGTCTGLWVNAVALLMGPLFSYALAWLGRSWLNQPSARRQSLGFSLVFGTVMPARLITALIGGGDEVTLARLLVGDATVGRWLGLLVTVSLATPPLWRAFQRIPRPNWVAYSLTITFVPLLLEWFLVFRGLGSLLQRGVGAAPGLLGMPQLVTYWTVAMVLVLMGCYRGLTGLFTARSHDHSHQPIGAAKPDFP